MTYRRTDMHDDIYKYHSSYICVIRRPLFMYITEIELYLLLGDVLVYAVGG